MFRKNSCRKEEDAKLTVFITIPTNLPEIVLVLVMGICRLGCRLPIVVSMRSQQIHGYFFTAKPPTPKAF
ncbi:hypothetical protein GS601_10020 [Myxacorys almedinensis A]|uniref:Uncharacterized protein n=1 Tax=Myxacorys almedinensis A TaxID=2690445 RepID=A0A8J7Z739_9CYAN|nr:hypothetical protein [Myxacorys almedinensis A]